MDINRAGFPCLFCLGTVLGALSLIITSLIYLKASLAGELWVPCEKEVEQERSLTRAQPPTVAPPRMVNTKPHPTFNDNKTYQNCDPTSIP